MKSDNKSLTELSIKIATLTFTKFLPWIRQSSRFYNQSNLTKDIFSIFSSNLYLWALRDVTSSNTREFRIKINQSERDTRGRPLWSFIKVLFDFPTSDLTLLWALCGDFFAKYCDSPNMGLLYCKFNALFLCLLGLIRFADLISLYFSGIFLSCFVTFTRALYGPQTDVVQLTANNFKSMVTDSDTVWLVEFFAPWYVFLLVKWCSYSWKYVSYCSTCHCDRLWHVRNSHASEI